MAMLPHHFMGHLWCRCRCHIHGISPRHGMHQRRIWTALLWTALLAAVAAWGPIEADAAASCGADGAAPAVSVLAVGAKVADWQLNHLDNFDYVRDTAFRRQTAAPRDWIQAAF